LIRITSAAALIGILVVTLWWLPPWATVVLAALFAGLAAGEVADLAARVSGQSPRAFVAVSAAAVTASLAVPDAGGLLREDLLAVVAMALVVAGGLVALASGPPSPAAITRAAVTIMAPIYVGVPLGTMARIRATDGPAVLFWLLAVIAASDSAQYFTGRAFGRRKLAPLVSPAKTVEGAIGGLVIGALAGVLAGAWALPALSLAATGLAGALLAAVGMGGDLFESLLKRGAGVKDSSSLIPGHGGALDRIDAYLFAAPCYYLFLRYLA
jgi:phosphatidate cytidylyltransferase